MKKEFVSYVLILIIFACNPKEQNTHDFSDMRDTLKGERLLLFSQDSASVNSTDAPFVQNFGKVLKLPPLKNGVKGTAVRIWVWHPDSNFVINILHHADTGNLHVIEFHGKKIDSLWYIAVRREWKNLVPKQSWSTFINELSQREILSLESGKTTGEMGDHLTHPFYVQFEVAQSQYYRYYKYLSPFFYRYVDHGSDQVNEFLKFLNAETGIPIYKPTENLFQERKVDSGSNADPAITVTKKKRK